MVCSVISAFRSLALAMAVVFGIGTASAQTGAEITGVQLAYDGFGTTRVVIHANQNLDYKELALFDNGLKYVLDFDHLEWKLPGEDASSGAGAGVGDIHAFRYAQYTPEVSRLVFDLEHPVTVDSSFVARPDRPDGSWRIVIDFRRTDFESFKTMRPQKSRLEADNVSLTKLKAPPPSIVDVRVEDIFARKPETLIKPQADMTPDASLEVHKPVIVIDAGHGGRDPGAIGLVRGLKEKDVNLQAAQKLRDLLVASGHYEVIMTRDSDILLDYEERLRIAREANADLFISLHADSAGNQSVRGASVYTLSEKGDKRLKGKLQDGDWDMPLEVHAVYDEAPDAEVEQILLSMMQRETLANSAEFAELLIPQLAAAGPVLRNTHREANFYVLLSPNVPAVLLEIGFLSNASDEARLSDPQGIDQSMRAVKSAIDIHFSAEIRRQGNLNTASVNSRAG